MAKAQPTNCLYYGDNLDILRRYVSDESVDLVYLDPPFNSQATYNLLFKEEGSHATAQIKAFGDTWRWDDGAANAFADAVSQGGQLSLTLQAFRSFLGQSNMLAYLAMMAPRLVELQRVLKPHGSIYLHCDPTSSHYLKLLMDAVFRPKFFRNEIAWCYRKWSVAASQFARNHDVLLFYSKSDTPRFNNLFVPLSPGTMKRWKGQKQQAAFDAEGRRLATSEAIVSSGSPMPDWWDISILNPNADERLGYPTQKPEALLERVVSASSNPGDVVLDPFCGCGTTVAVAQRLDRQWIGIDITHLAIGLIRHRLVDAYGSAVDGTFRVVGEPVSLDDAKTLAESDPYQFQAWALGLVGARQSEVKKGADRGIDGRRYFTDPSTSKTGQILFSVKAGHTTSAHVRDLRGVIERESAAMGVLLSMEQPTKQMRAEAASAGPIQTAWGRYPRIQLRTIEELLSGLRLEAPDPLDVTYKQAPRVVREPVAEQAEFQLESPTPKKKMAKASLPLGFASSQTRGNKRRK